jgi:glycosyltransferase involved in cell wall biosynthesis
MRIGMDTRILSWSGSGPWRYLCNLLKELARIDQDNEYFLFSDKNESASGIAWSNMKKIMIRSCFKGHVADPVWNNMLLPVALRRNRIDIFHSPYNILPLVKICPSIVTIHDVAFEIYPEDFPIADRVYLKMFTCLAAEAADIVIVPSTHVGMNVAQIYKIPESKVRVIYEAADEIFRPMDKQEAKERIAQEYGIENDFILYVGFVRPRRNVLTLLKAFHRLRKQYNLRHKLIIVGKNLGSIDFLNFVKSDQEKELIHFNYIPDKDLPLLYNAAEIFVYPSLYEGFGLPLVEAMACGTPIVASNSPPMPEIVGDAGLFVDPLDVSQMAQTIYEVLADENLRSNLREKSLKRSLLFTWKKTAEKTSSLYKEIERNLPLEAKT